MKGKALFFPCKTGGLTREIWPVDFALSPMTQPAFFLFSPSCEDARRLGMGDWYDWFQSQEGVQVVEDTRDVSGGIFISFRPVREEADTFPELEERAARWLALDSDGNVSSSCLVARNAGVDRLLHAQLIDEMSSPVIPSALLYLMDRGIWLPDTFLKPVNLTFPPKGLSPVLDEGLLLFLVDEEFVENWSLRSALDLLRGDLNPFGCRTKVLNLKVFGAGKEAEYPSHVVLLSDRHELVVEISRWANRNSVSFAVCESFESSPLRWIFAGGSYPVPIPCSTGKLRPFFEGLGRFVHRKDAVYFPIPEKDQCWKQPSSLEDFKFAWVEMSEPASNMPAVFATFLSSSLGDRFLRWGKGRIGERSTHQYTALNYSCLFFKEHNPFEILCDERLRKRCRAGLVRLRELLEEGYKASQGNGTINVLHLSWCSVLLEDFGKVEYYFASAKNPSFSALSGYAAEIGLALFYSGQGDVARNCVDASQSIETATDKRTCRFKTVCTLVESRDIEAPLAKETLACKDWVAVQAAAMASQREGDRLWKAAAKLDPVRTEAFAKVRGSKLKR